MVYRPETERFGTYGIIEESSVLGMNGRSRYIVLTHNHL